MSHKKKKHTLVVSHLDFFIMHIDLESSKCFDEFKASWKFQTVFRQFKINSQVESKRGPINRSLLTCLSPEPIEKTKASKNDLLKHRAKRHRKECILLMGLPLPRWKDWEEAGNSCLVSLSKVTAQMKPAGPGGPNEGTTETPGQQRHLWCFLCMIHKIRLVVLILRFGPC